MNKLFIFLLLCILIVSCKSSNDPEVVYADWNLKNKQYFNQMKDSADYVLYNIPSSRGGNSFYYKILSPGTQTSESASDSTRIYINYRGKLITGSVFDQTYSGNSALNDNTALPSWFRMKDLKIGLVENLKLMKIGEVRRFILPQELGYGTEIDHPAIPPYSTTIWDVQLIHSDN